MNNKWESSFYLANERYNFLINEKELNVWKLNIQLIIDVWNAMIFLNIRETQFCSKNWNPVLRYFWRTVKCRTWSSYRLWPRSDMSSTWSAVNLSLACKVFGVFLMSISIHVWCPKIKPELKAYFELLTSHFGLSVKRSIY